MKNLKKIAIIGAAVLVLGAISVTAAAASAVCSTPAEIVPGLTGQTADSGIPQRAETGKTYGTYRAGGRRQEPFEQQMLEQKKAHSMSRVAAGTMTQERARRLIRRLEDTRQTCVPPAPTAGCSNATGSLRRASQRQRGSAWRQRQRAR
jgi:hypothetical protein